MVKNKVAPPFREAEFDILYGQGISREGELIDLGVKNDLIVKSGSWFSYGELRLGQGKENSREYLKAHPELMDELESKIRAILMKKPEEGQAPAETPSKAFASSVSQAGTGNEAGAVSAPAAPRGAGKPEARGSASKKLDISAEDFE